MEFKIIVSTQEQYSVWPEEVDAPLGWTLGTLTEASLEKCLEYIGGIMAEEVAEGEPMPPFVVIINEDDMLSLNRVDREIPEGWYTATEPTTLSGCLDFIARAWTGAGPLPEPFRRGTGESPADAL